MEKRRLGKTGFDVSIISIGGIPLQRVSQEEATAILKKGLKKE